ncbi:hypothetical protein EV175_007381, partial [Coemansia sp. RSA 1933]
MDSYPPEKSSLPNGPFDHAGNSNGDQDGSAERGFQGNDYPSGQQYPPEKHSVSNESSGYAGNNYDEQDGSGERGLFHSSHSSGQRPQQQQQPYPPASYS